MSPERYRELKQNSKADKLFIGIGCSFTQGQGALSDEVWEKYNWNIPNTHEFSELEPLEVQGSWVHQICDTYMPDWKPINLGERGGGNRAASKTLTSLFPEFNLDDPDKEKIVVFMLTGPERYSITHGNWDKRFHQVFETLWPNPDAGNELWKNYANLIYSPRQTMLETYFSVKEVQNWCKANNAKLLLVSGFDFSYSKEYTPGNFRNLLDMDWEFDLWKPLGHPSVFHLLLDKDGFDYSIQDGGYWHALNYNDAYPKGTPHVSRCCHPNLKGHTVISKVMYQELMNRKFVDSQ